MVVNVNAFRQFVQTEYKLSHWAGQQRDTARQRPQISAVVIFKAIVYQAVLGFKSLLRLDQFLRLVAARRLMDSPRGMVASDSTLLRVLGQWQMSCLRAASYALHRHLCDRGEVQTVLEKGRKVRLAIVDGSNFGVWQGSVLGFAGAIYHSVDVERSEGRGHELATSRRLIARAKEQLGPGFATHLVYDGLMADRHDLRMARQHWGVHLVVKTQEQTLEIIDSSRAVWSEASAQELEQAGVEVVRGLDTERMQEYEIYAQGGIRWEGLKETLKLAWVREGPLKGKYAGQRLEFWVISTDESLTAIQLRQIAHVRWAIENRGFKQLNARVGSKKGYIKNPGAKEALLLMWWMGMALLEMFTAWLEQQRAWRDWGVKKTKALIADCIVSTMVLECGSSP